MKFILNIGLNIGATTSLSATVAKQILIANDFILGREALVQSDTEPALVIEATFPGTSAMLALQCLYRTAEDLEQDCIAVYRPLTKKGALVGPGAAKWGAFNPEFFFTLDGKRMAQPVSA